MEKGPINLEWKEYFIAFILIGIFSVLLILHTGKKNVVVEKIYAVFCNKLCAAHHRIIRFPRPTCFFTISSDVLE
jgi:hypothetical protein